MTDNAYDLTVHDIQVQDIHTFTRTGGIVMQSRVTYYVGDHGPFILVYDQSKATTERIKSDIDARVKQLAALTGYPQPAS